MKPKLFCFLLPGGANMWQHLDEQEKIIRALSTVFPTVQASYIPVPNFSCGQNSMLIASKNKVKSYHKLNGLHLVFIYAIVLFNVD